MLSSPPTAGHESWRFREEEAMRRNGSVEPAKLPLSLFVRSCSQHDGVLRLLRTLWKKLAVVCSVLKTSCHGHGRISLLI